jgi:hypothetical protein
VSSSDRDPPRPPQKSTLRGSFDRSIPVQTTEPMMRSAMPIPDPASEPPLVIAPSLVPAPMANTPADESLSQIRSLLFGELQAQHERRLRKIEDDLAALRNESRAQLESWVGHFTNELADLTSSTKSRLDSIDDGIRAQTAQIQARFEDQGVATKVSLEALVAEIQSLRAGFSAISTVVMDEIKDAETRLLEDVTQKVAGLRGELGRLFAGASQTMSDGEK